MSITITTTIYRLTYAPDGCGVSFLGDYQTCEDAEEAADRAAETGYTGLEESLWDTARAAGHCGGQYAPELGDEVDGSDEWPIDDQPYCITQVDLLREIKDRDDLPSEWLDDHRHEADYLLDAAQGLDCEQDPDATHTAHWRDSEGSVYRIDGHAYELGGRYVVWTTSPETYEDEWDVLDAESAEAAAREHAHDIAGGLDEGPQDEPECEHEDGHDWSSDYDLVGGCRENPGVWSAGGTTITSLEVCTRCGMRRESVAYGPQRNPGDQDGTTYIDAEGNQLAFLADI